MEACRKVHCLKRVVGERVKYGQAEWQIKTFRLGLTNIISCGSTISTVVFDRDTATMEDITQRGRKLYPLHRIISEKDLHSILSLKEELRQRATISR